MPTYTLQGPSSEGQSLPLSDIFLLPQTTPQCFGVLPGNMAEDNQGTERSIEVTINVYGPIDFTYPNSL